MKSALAYSEGREADRTAPEGQNARKPTFLKMGFARTLISQGFRLGESFSTASQPAKTLVIGYYGLRRRFVKLKKISVFSTA